MNLTLLIGAAVIVAVLLQTLILYVSTKILKISATTLKTSLKIVLLDDAIVIAIAIVGGILFGVIGAKSTALEFIIANILGLIVGFFVLNFLLKKYYGTGFLKNLGVYIVQGLLGLVIGVVVGSSIRGFVTEPFIVSGSGMAPNFPSGQKLLLEKWNKSYKRGDVVVFKYPKDQSQFFIKRIIGLPGETVTIQDGKVYINGQALDESGYLPADLLSQTFGNAEPVILKDKEYFVLGDNRKASSDSRIWGTLPASLVIGKYWVKQ
jgi:signal peptidase I